MGDESNGNVDTVDLDAVFPNDSQVTIGESDRLKFAKQVLFWLGLICIGVFIAYGISPDNKAMAAIFELIKIGALPLITLVVFFISPSLLIKTLNKLSQRLSATHPPTGNRQVSVSMTSV